MSSPSSIQSAPGRAPRLAGHVRVFDPAMCCATGICGPGVDPELLRVARDLRWLEARGAAVERHSLAQSPQAFVGEPLVAELLRTRGDAALPATLVNGVLLASGRYPTRDDLVAALGGDRASAPSPRAALPVADGCCQPGSGCC